MASDGGGGAGADRVLDGEQGWGAGSRVGRFYSDYASPQPQLQMLATTTVTTSTIPAVSVLDREPTAYGAGGRSRLERKRSGKRSAPYDRPATGRHAAAGPQAAAIRSAAPSQALVERVRGGSADWLGSGFSKIISNGATYLYSSIFRRQLAPPLRVANRPSVQQVANVDPEPLDANDLLSSPSAAENDDILVGSGQLVAVNDRDALEPVVANSGQLNFEDLFKKKTLSREEFERLTSLLQSRVVSNGAEMKQQSSPRDEFEVGTSRREIQSPAVISAPIDSDTQRWRQDSQKVREERESNVRALTIYENGRSSSATPRDMERVDSLTGSPVEVAIAFMGGRTPQPTGASPVQSLNQRDENRVSSGPAPSLNTSQTPSVKRADTDVMNEDQLRTPTPTSVYPWGRDRTIYRTPYSRPVRLQPPKERAVDGTFGTPSVNRWTPIRTPVTGGREMLKRRSTVLDEGWSSGGPIRRIRHKPTVPGSVSNLSRPRASPFPRTPFATPVEKFDIESASPRGVAGNSSKKDALIESASFYVPAQSSATARKILETLERMTPSPKGKALTEELAIVRGRPTELTEGMLNDQARKSMSVVDFPLPNEAREPGPSSRMVDDSPTSGLPANSGRMGASSKGKGEVKSNSFAIGNGPTGLAGTGMSSHAARMEDGSAKLFPAVSSEADLASSSGAGRSKGFHMSATFEESGSEDEGRTAKGSPSLPLPKSTGALKTSNVLPPIFPSTVVNAATVTTAASSAVTTGISLGISKPPPSSGFTFPTRASLDGPPTPKPMFPATTPPPPATGTSFFQFGKATADGLGASRSSLDPSAGNTNEEAPSDAKSEFSFGPPGAFPSVEPAQPKLQVPPESKVTNVTKNTFPSAGNSSAITLPATSSAFPGAAAASFSAPSIAPKFGGSTALAANSTAPKAELAPPSMSSFSTTSSSSIFGNSLSQSSSGMAPGNIFAGSSSSPFGASLSSGSLFGSGDKIGSSSASAPSLFKFGHANPFSAKPFPSKTESSSVAAEPQPVDANDDTRAPPEPERPQKRPTPSLQQDFRSAETQPSTTPAPAFATFGASAFGASATGPATTSSFAAGTSGKLSTSQVPSPLSFGQTSSAPQAALTGASSAAASSPFTFGASASAGESASNAIATGFGSASSFPSLSSPAFASSSSGSLFGATAAAPISFGSSSAATTFGSMGASFGGFGSGTAQSPSSSLFGFSSPAPSSSPAFGFGAGSSPSFAFGSGAANSSSSGSPFTFGSSPAFPFSAGNDKAGTAASPPTLFGAASSVPAFGSTTNGSMPGALLVNEQTNMDDNSMADVPSEPSPTSANVFGQPPAFGGQSSAAPGSFVFGSQAGAPALGQQPAFGSFSAPSNPPAFGAAAAANPFAPGAGSGPLEYGGGSFALGAGGDRPARKIFKAKRTGAKGRK